MKKPKDPRKESIKFVNTMIKNTKVYAPEEGRKEKINQLKALKKHYQRGSK